MVWVHFKEAFSFKPTPNSTTDYPKGAVANVTRRCADEVVAKGKGVVQETAKPAKAKSSGE